MKLVSGLVAVMMVATSAGAHAAREKTCGPLENAFGPFDYSDAAHRKDLEVVERFHFTSKVEHLIVGTTGNLGGDIDYTLRAFPNHPRALAAMAKLSLREKTARPAGANYPTACYFERAIRFKPQDGMVRMVYSNFLNNIGEHEKAFEQLSEAQRMEPENANINYNLGLMYFKKRDYDQASVYAKKAYSTGFPLPWLKQRLIEVGKWNEAP